MLMLMRMPYDPPSPESIAGSIAGALAESMARSIGEGAVREGRRADGVEMHGRRGADGRGGRAGAPWQERPLGP